VRGIVCRALRLQLVAAIGIALAIPALATPAENTSRQATQTAISVETHDQAGRTRATVAVTVNGEDGLPAKGAVTISEHGNPLAGAALNARGEASIVVALPAGSHTLVAEYAGNATHLGSVSQSAVAEAQTGTTPNFAVSVSNLSPASTPANTLIPGNSGTATVTITPQNNATLTAPMFVTLSCSGLPDESACTFTPENLEILASTPTSCTAGSPAASCPPTSSMVITTQLGSQGVTQLRQHSRSNPVALAFLVPGALALGGLAWGARRRPWLNRLSLLALLGLVTMLGTTACNPRYDYLNHGPPPNPATPAGTYTITVTAQTSNGVTAITNNTTFALTVQ